MCFVFIWEQTATCATYIINWLVFITGMKSIYCAVRTGSLNKAVWASYLKGSIAIQALSASEMVSGCQASWEEIITKQTLHSVMICVHCPTCCALCIVWKNIIRRLRQIFSASDRVFLSKESNRLRVVLPWRQKQSRLPKRRTLKNSMVTKPKK